MKFVPVTEVTTTYRDGTVGGKTIFINLDHVMQMYRSEHAPVPGEIVLTKVEATTLVLHPHGEQIKVIEPIEQILWYTK